MFLITTLLPPPVNKKYLPAFPVARYYCEAWVFGMATLYLYKGKGVC